MDSLGDIFPKMMKNLGLAHRYKAETILLNWRQIVGEEIAAHTRPGRINRRVLTLAANNAVWAHHLSTLKEEIIAKINAFAGEKAVSDLKFQAGYFRNDQNEENGDDDEPPAVTWREASLDSRETKAVEEIAAPLADTLLRAKVKRLLGKDFALKKARRRHDWQPCRQCGVLRPPGEELCRACAAAARAASRAAVRSLLREAPWLSYDECSQYTACRRNDFAAVRDELADTILRSVAHDEADRVGLPMLTMLLFGVKPREITEEMTAKTLAKVRRKSDVSASRR
jgi:hypothetical protein